MIDRRDSWERGGAVGFVSVSGFIPRDNTTTGAPQRSARKRFRDLYPSLPRAPCLQASGACQEPGFPATASPALRCLHQRIGDARPATEQNIKQHHRFRPECPKKSNGGDASEEAGPGLLLKSAAANTVPAIPKSVTREIGRASC